MSYIVIKGPVLHDGKTFDEGQEIPGLTEKEVDSLLAVKVIAKNERLKPGRRGEGDAEDDK